MLRYSSTLLVVASAAILLAGCGNTEAPAAAASVAAPTPQIIYVTPAPEAVTSASPTAPEPSPSPTVAPAATPAPAPTQDELRVTAGKAYLAAVKPANKAADRLWKQYKNKNSLSANRKYCAKIAVVDRTELLRLNAIDYPKDTVADVKNLIRHLAAEEAEFRSCAKARSLLNWYREWNLADKANTKGHEAANLVRLDLGLPPVGAVIVSA